MVNFQNNPRLARSPWINPGALRHAIQIIPFGISAPDASGNVTKVYKPNLAYKCWAKIDVISDKQVNYGESFQTESTHQITARYDPDFVPTANMQILTGDGNTYTINSVIDFEGRHQFIVLLCTALEGVAWL